MEKLKEDYVNGEKFFAEDMNKMTHIINKLDDGTIVVDRLPDTGETGVIYSIPDYSDSSHVQDGYLDLAKTESGTFVGDNEVDGESGLTINEIIKVANSYTGDTYVATSIDLNNLACEYSGEGIVVKGITSYTKIQADHYYKVIGIYEITKLPNQMYFYGSNAKIEIILYRDVTNEVDDYHMWSKSVPSIHMFMTFDSYSNMVMPILRSGNTFGVTMVGYNGDGFKVGDEFKYIGETSLSGFSILNVTSVDANNLYVSAINDSSPKITSGIESYENVKRNSYYKITGKYKFNYDEFQQVNIELGKKAASSYLYNEEMITIPNFHLYTVEEIPYNNEIVTELDVMPGFVFYVPFYSCKRRMEYIYINNHWERMTTTENDIEHVISNQIYSGERLLTSKGSSSPIYNVWVGTQAQYNSLSYKNSTTLYFITAS